MAPRCIEQWTLGWTPEGSDAGPAFIVDERDPFVGIVHLSPSSERRMELLYGVLPTARGRDVATRAVRLATTWALGDGGFTRVELKVEEGHLASRRVAEKVGFQLVERLETYVAGTGQTHIDCLYLRTNK